ncbi:MAG TPA: SAM-dependent methyltransferase [Bacillota bacterium]|nr:SAM-dependent methyltransferase [Bacillota bacterium]
MTVKYQSIVPWGRSFEEYIRMFNLSDADLNRNILGCGDGPASFNSRMNQKGKKVISIDPIYQFSTDDIARRIDVTYETVMNQTRQNQDKFIWSSIKNIEELGKIRMKAMKEFLNDFAVGEREGRYIFAELPVLPFTNRQFDLALSSHFLFLYTGNLSLEFHLEAIREMLRVAKEVRIFPLLDVNSIRSPFVNEVMRRFNAKGYDAHEVTVDYEFQKGGNQLLKIVHHD